MTKTRKKASKKARKSEPQKPSNSTRIDALDYALRRLEHQVTRFADQLSTLRASHESASMLERQVRELIADRKREDFALEKAVARIIAAAQRA